jgi:hypothetical protein
MNQRDMTNCSVGVKHCELPLPPGTGRLLRFAEFESTFKHDAVILHALLAGHSSHASTTSAPRHIVAELAHHARASSVSSIAVTGWTLAAKHLDRAQLPEQCACVANAREQALLSPGVA